MGHGIGTLYVVGTPIGNLEDITFRCIQTLKTVSRIVSEKPATTKKLLNKYGISTPLSAYHEHLCGSNWERVLSWLKAGDSVALVSEAGMPCLEDPGVELVSQCHKNKIPVAVIPGVSAAISALAVSGFSSSMFTFFGFLPKKTSELIDTIKKMSLLEHTLIFYESPRRLLNTLKLMAEYIQDRPIAVCRELTKKFEEIIRGTSSEIINHFQLKQPLGEFTILISSYQSENLKTPATDEEVLEKINEMLSKGMSRSVAAKNTSLQLGISKRHAYLLAHKLESP